jgi:hypothetical protein
LLLLLLLLLLPVPPKQQSVKMIKQNVESQKCHQLRYTWVQVSEVLHTVKLHFFTFMSSEKFMASPPRACITHNADSW